MRSLGMNPTEAEVTEIYGAVGGADTITEAQLIQAAEMMQGKMAGDQKAALLEAFTVFDKENNGHVPGAEVKHMLHNLPVTLTEDEMDDLMAEIESATGGVDFKKLTESIFTKIDCKSEQRREIATKMAEIKEYMSKPPAA